MNDPAAPRIDLDDEDAAETWARKLDVTIEQLREAVEAVGTDASDVELHLKGTRSTTLGEITRASNAGPPPASG